MVDLLHNSNAIPQLSFYIVFLCRCFCCARRWSPSNLAADSGRHVACVHYNKNDIFTSLESGYGNQGAVTVKKLDRTT